MGAPSEPRHSQEQELYRSTPQTIIGALAISPDRSRVVFVLRQRDMPQRLMSVSVADGKAVQTDCKVEHGIVVGLSIHPDGKRITYQVSTTGESEILSLDRVLPPAKP